jgi:hypothetical protein
MLPQEHQEHIHNGTNYNRSDVVIIANSMCSVHVHLLCFLYPRFFANVLSFNSYLLGAVLIAVIFCSIATT